MITVILSAKYQVVIPSDIRDRLKLKPGQKVAVIEKDGVIHLIPIRPLKDLKGMAAGTTSKGLRDEGSILDLAGLLSSKEKTELRSKVRGSRNESRKRLTETTRKISRS